MGTGTPGTRAGLAVAGLFALLAPAVLRAADEDRFVVADFDAAEKVATVSAEGSQFRVAPEAAGSKNMVGSWLVPAGSKATLVLRNLPPDFPAWKALRLRIRREADLQASRGPGIPFVAVLSAPGDEASARMPGIGTAWRTFVFDLDRMALRGAFDAAKAKDIRLQLPLPAGGGGFLVDDVVLEREYAEPLDRRARGLDPAWTVEEFEAAGLEDRVEGSGGSLLPMAEKATGFLRWTHPGGAKPAALSFLDLPRDLGAYRSIRLRVRNEKEHGGAAVPLQVRLRSGPSGALAAVVKRAGTKWEAVEIPLAGMKEDGKFDASRCDVLEIAAAPSEAGAIDLDDVVLEKGPERLSAADRAVLETLFGKPKAFKGLVRRTRHFDLYTDSQAAAERLPDGLEKAYAFVRDALGLPEMESALPVYCFQNATVLLDFLEQERGLSKQRNLRTTAHGTARSLEFLYRTPEDGRTVRELAHSCFQRARGREGGSWMHEGMGIHLEQQWNKQDAAAEFAPRLRGGNFLPLRDLVAIPELQEHDDPRGGIGDRWSVLLEAGALYEFLVRGPLSEKWREAERVLARRKVDPADRVKSIEEALGMTLSDLEKAWVEWGSRAGKGK